MSPTRRALARAAGATARTAAAAARRHPQRRGAGRRRRAAAGCAALRAGPRRQGARRARCSTQLTRADALDFFVLFSSVAAVLGSAGQANHSAANAFLDLLARERRSRGLPGLSINWGAWTEVGAAAERGVAERIAAQGLADVHARTRACRRSSGCWRRPRRRSRCCRSTGGVTPSTPAVARTPRLPERAGRGRGHVAAARAGRGAAPGESADAAGRAPRRARRRPLLAAFVRDTARGARSAWTPPGPSIRGRRSASWGSIRCWRWNCATLLGTALGRSLPATLLFDHPTIDALTDHLLAELFAPAAEGPTAAAGKPVAAGSAVVDSIEDLSDEEVERQLAARSRAKA